MGQYMNPFSLQTIESLYDYYGWDDFEKLKKEGEKESKDDLKVKHSTTPINKKTTKKGSKSGKKPTKKAAKKP